jgi:hypothetical protein
MHRLVQPPARPVIAEGGGQIAGDAHLHFGGNFGAQASGRGAQHAAAQGHQPRAHRPNTRQSVGGGAGFVIVQQRVISPALVPPPAPAASSRFSATTCCRVGRKCATSLRARASAQMPWASAGHAGEFLRQTRGDLAWRA